MIKKISRSIVFPVFHHLGITKATSLFSKNQNLILLYHGVTQKNSNYFSGRHIEAKQFEEHIKYVSRNFEILTLEDLIQSKNQVGNKRKVAITFDDGYRNNLTNALPILEKYKVPATFFISGVCASDEMQMPLFPDIIALLEYKRPDIPVRLMNNVCLNVKDLKPGQLYSQVKSYTLKQREAFLNQVNQMFDIQSEMQTIDAEIWKILNKSELKQLSQSKLVTIGSHGVHHLLLSEISEQERMNELESSKKLLEENIKKPVTMLAYPDGNYSKRVIRDALQVGYTTQFAVMDDSFKNGIINEFTFQRHVISSTTTFESCMFFIHKAFNNRGF